MNCGEKGGAYASSLGGHASKIVGIGGNNGAVSLG